MPVHPDSGIFFAARLRYRAEGRHSRQALQRLLCLSQAEFLRRGCHGTRGRPNVRDPVSAEFVAGETPDMRGDLPPRESIQVPAGFAFSSVAAAIKVSGRTDLGLVECVSGTTATAVFTTNRVAAAPVQVGRASLQSNRGAVRAVVVNSGNANCATGQHGVE